MKVRRLLNDVLEHHGIKGQQWGVRNGPPYPIEDTTLKKGTRLKTVVGAYIGKGYASPNYLNLMSPDINKHDKGSKNQWMYTYNNDYDEKVYKGPFSKYLVQRGANYIKEHEYETVKDLKMPTKKQRVDEFIETYNNNKEVFNKDLKTVQDMLIQYKVGSDKEQKEYKEFNVDKFDISDEAQRNVAYSIFNHMMERVDRYESTKAYKKQIESKFDAMVDDNNQGVYNDAKDPIIIFRAENVLKSIGSKSVTSSEIIENTESIRKELSKKGMNIKL